MTLDMNCLIELEGSGEAAALSTLRDWHKSQKITVLIPAIGASEHNGPDTVEVFKRRVAALGLGDAELLRPTAYWDITFWDWCDWATDESTRIEGQIESILFPGLADESKTRGHAGDGEVGQPFDRKWLNKKCDVLAMLSHITYGGQSFVTRDKNFHKSTKKPALIALGAGRIETPEEAVERIAAGMEPEAST